MLWTKKLQSMLWFYAFTVSPKSVAASRGELLAGRLVFSLGTRYLIISPCRWSGRGQQSVTVASLFMVCLYLWRRKPLPNVPVCTNKIITPSPITVTACYGLWGHRLVEMNHSQVHQIYYEYCIYCGGPIISKQHLLGSEASTFQLQHAFGFQRTAYFFRPN